MSAFPMASGWRKERWAPPCLVQIRCMRYGECTAAAVGPPHYAWSPPAITSPRDLQATTLSSGRETLCVLANHAREQNTPLPTALQHSMLGNIQATCMGPTHSACALPCPNASLLLLQLLHGHQREQIVDQIGTADNPGPCFGTTNECLGSQVSCGHPPSCLPPQNKLRVASRSLWMPLHHCLPSCCPPTDLLPNRPLCHLPGRRRLLPHLHHRPARLFAAVSQRCTTCNAGHNTLCRWSWHAAGRHATLHPAAAPLG